MASSGKMEEFDPKNTNIDLYLDRPEEYFVANEVEADFSSLARRRAILISVVGGKTHMDKGGFVTDFYGALFYPPSGKIGPRKNRSQNAPLSMCVSETRLTDICNRIIFSIEEMWR